MTENRVVALRQKGAPTIRSPNLRTGGKLADRPGGRGGVRDISGLDR